ncbi:hypothetical protein L211DRAFT_864784 [Terfezia boudieri ATCC MYA-4762]|uniref:Uncharacterized protein n=1 Tax=Terfezia boudieri ATCC MYA-4762 TaxID=1051890 RepID=A0A3N4M2H4_9PEZI|nr:hypothetical protein L211DRAFT_864784 [Terfezia boudieri ATCC MYA-4762]
METNEGISIPSNNPPAVGQWNPIHVKEFLEANRDCCQFSDRDIGLISEEGVGGFVLLRLTEGRLLEYGLKRGPAFGVAQLVIDLHNKTEIVDYYCEWTPTLWGPGLKLQPSKRKPFQETAELLQVKRPVILHGPYHSGKTTFLWAMEEYLRASDMYPVYISMTEGDFHCRDHIESLYALLSLRIFGQYLDGKDLRSQISKTYNQRTGHGETTKRKCLCLLIDEMQMIYLSPGLLSEAKRFFESLTTMLIPYIGVGTFQLSELNWGTGPEESLCSPFNKATFSKMQPFTIREMSAIFTKFTEAWGISIPDSLQLAIMVESGGHAASLMALLKLYYERRPTTQTWRIVLQTEYQDYLNGVRKMIKRNLRSNKELCDHLRNLTVHAGETWKLELDCLGTLDKILLYTGIIGEAVFPCCTPLATVEGPIELITTAVQHLSPKQLRNKQMYNKAGPSENAFHVELYAILRHILPEQWLCSSEARMPGQAKRLDLLIHKGITNWAGIELKMNKVTADDFDAPLKQCEEYANEYQTVIYLVNFSAATHESSNSEWCGGCQHTI